jgi:hypothetical protein
LQFGRTTQAYATIAYVCDNPLYGPKLLFLGNGALND